ncbi:MAG: hypothetical protein IT223_11060, partial [Crocinitomicaceae bacterium]|nr:hypothetical protein [Crocinitomicaceae bacterium]
LELDANDKGFLLPRLTTAERIALVNPAVGLQIYNTEKNCIEFFTGMGWKDLCGENACDIPPGSAPAAGSHTSTVSQISWSWNTVSGAGGYKFNTTNNYVTATDSDGITSYVQSGLTCNTSYTLYVWAYNSCGASPAQTLSASTSSCPFVCGSSTVTDTDGNTYNTVLIGGQCWMNENLNTTKKPDSTSLTRYCYNNNATNCSTYGGLYTWATAMNGSSSSSSNPSGVQGICPAGWHLPSAAEWLVLQNIFGAIEVAGGPLKTTGTSNWQSPNTAATNTSGFSGLPGGSRLSDTSYAEFNYRGDWWYATEVSGTTATTRNLYYSHGGFYESVRNKGDAVSVRCIRN